MTPFYDLSDAERAELTRRAIDGRKSLVRRWRALTDAEAHGWRSRAAIAASMLGKVQSVLDLGCGTMALREFLDPGVIYIPSDIVSRCPGTIVCDYNKEEPPHVEVEAVACLGLLEYLFEPGALLHALKQPRAVVSYCPCDAPSPMQGRRSHGWVNDYSTETMCALFGQAGWNIVQHVAESSRQSIWLLERVG